MQILVKLLSPFERLQKFCGSQIRQDPLQSLNSALQELASSKDKVHREAAIGKVHGAGVRLAKGSTGDNLVRAVQGLVTAAAATERDSPKSKVILNDALDHTPRFRKEFLVEAAAADAAIGDLLVPCTDLERRAARSFRDHLEAIESAFGKGPACLSARVHGEDAGIASSIRCYAGDFLWEHREPGSFAFVKPMVATTEGEVPGWPSRQGGSPNPRPAGP